MRTVGIMFMFGVGAFALQLKNTMVRKETFAKNFDSIKSKYEE